MSYLLRSYLDISETPSQCALAAALFPWSIPPILPSKTPSEVLLWEKQTLSTASRIQIPKSGFEIPKRLKRCCTPLTASTQTSWRVLRFPLWLHEEFQASEKEYCIWDESDTLSTIATNHRRRGHQHTAPRVVEVECYALCKLISKSYPRAKLIKDPMVSKPNGFTMVFVHAASLKNLHKMPHFVELKRKKDAEGILNVAFYVFGTSMGMDPSGWRFEEVYPLGGVMTFTSTALAEDPAKLVKIIDCVADHALWVSYVLPSIIGLAVKLRYRESQLDPLQEFDRGTFVFNALLSAIDDGTIALTRSPPPSRDRAEVEQWLVEQNDTVFRDARETLEFCIKDFEGRYGHLKEEEWIKAVENQMANDMKDMQIQPVIMDNYRRMVVLQGPSAEEKSCDGFEWIRCETFRFDDDADNEL